MNNITKNIKLTVLYNNIESDPELETDWGFSCLIQGLKKNILFDTGDKGDILMQNISRTDLDPGQIDTLFLSHDHYDHTGGIEELLKQAPIETVYLLASFSDSLKHLEKSNSSKNIFTEKPLLITDKVMSSGEMGDDKKEQSLIIQTVNGLIVITGCAHPGIVNIVRRAREIYDDKVYLIMGGFHMKNLKTEDIEKTINQLKELGVAKVSPSHCTGQKAIKFFREAWQKNFIESGTGAIIECPL